MISQRLDQLGASLLLRVPVEGFPRREPRLRSVVLYRAIQRPSARRITEPAPLGVFTLLVLPLGITRPADRHRF
jgi:hypothetical protein